MLVVHMDSGLGNQMLDYAEYLAIKKSNPGKECYLENIVYDIPCKPGMFAIWNGYELEKVFGIKAPNIKSLFSNEKWSSICRSVVESNFWEEGWNYAPYITNALNDEGLEISNLGKQAERQLSDDKSIKGRIRYWMSCFFKTKVGYTCKRYLRLVMVNKLVDSATSKYDMYRVYPDDSFVGHSLKFEYKGFGIDKIEKELKAAFTFPKIIDEKNLEMLDIIKNTESVSIHARRSDMLSRNGYCYEYGFFKRSVRYIKRHVKDPVFIFFTDEKSIGWCEQNEKTFDLDFSKDEVYFVTWNTGENSFRDMQLMKECKHNIFTESSFGFWGAYLNENPNKITCAPDCTILATNTF